MYLLIFDIDGTLTNSVSLDDICYRETLFDLYQYEINDNDWEELKIESSGTDSFTTELILEMITKVSEHTPKIIQEKSSEIQSLFLRKLENLISSDNNLIKEVDGAIRFLDFLKNKKNIIIGISTGSWEDSGKIKLNAIGLKTSDFIYSNADYANYRKDIINNCIVKSKIKANSDFKKIIYFGDGVWDKVSAEILGIEFIGVDVNKNDKLKQIGTENVIENYNDLNLLNKLIFD